MATVINLTDANAELMSRAKEVLASNNPSDMLEMMKKLIGVRRGLDCKDPDEHHLYDELYKFVGRFQDALGKAQKGEAGMITRLTQLTERADTIPSLHAARQQVREAQGGCSTKARKVLSSLYRRLTAAMDSCNDVKARELLDLFNSLSRLVWGGIDDQNHPQASASYEQLLRVACDILEPKPYIKLAIGRVEASQGGYDGIKDVTLASITSTQDQFRVFEMEVGKKHQVAAKELGSRLEANIENGNTGAAINALDQLMKPANAAGLACFLGSVESCDTYIKEALDRLRPEQREYYARRRKQVLRRF